MIQYNVSTNHTRGITKIYSLTELYERLRKASKWFLHDVGDELEIRIVRVK